MLDQLRSARKLPEERDFREWKTALHEAYRATEAAEHLWHLPDGRTIRVVTTPNPQGGVIYLFEDVTERLDMARRYDALIRVQGETLDNLAEAVAVFGSDGRLRLHNPAFTDMWRLDAAALAERPHIETVIGWCQPLYDDDALWRALHGTVTAIEGREVVKSRLELRNGSVADLITVPLPDGATLIAFLDVTDTINVERALREKNEALEAADALKVDFVHHVSYELRSPLTNIIGFASLMGEPSLGALSAKQREYLGYINTSTNALLAIINDILDLATIDAGAMRLNLGSVDIRRTMHAAAEGIRDRLIKDDITLDIHARRRHRQLHRRRPAAAAGAVQPAGQRGRLLAAGLDHHADGRAPARRSGLHGGRQRRRHRARGAGPGVRLVRIALAGLAASRRGPRAVDRALVRRTARRHRDARFRGRPGHHGGLRIPDRAARRAAAHGGITRRSAHQVWPGEQQHDDARQDEARHFQNSNGLRSIRGTAVALRYFGLGCRRSNTNSDNSS